MEYMQISKIIKKFGNSKMILLTTDELKMLDKQIGDVITLDFNSVEEQDKERDELHRIDRTRSYKDYVADQKDAIERGFNRERFILTEAQHKIYKNHFDKKTGRLKDKEKYSKWWDEIVKEFRGRIWNKNVITGEAKK